MAMKVLSALSVPTPTTNEMPVNKEYADKIGILEWDSSKTYAKGSIVRYDGKIFISIVSNGVYHSNKGQYPTGKDEEGNVVNNTYNILQNGEYVSVESATPIYWREYNYCGTFRGTYDSTYTYMPYDIVRYDTVGDSSATGLVYMVKPTVTGLVKGTKPTSTSTWTLISAIASNTTFGIAKVDNTTIVSNNGVLSVVGGSGGGSSSVSVASGNGISVTGSYTVAVDLATVSGLGFESETNKLQVKVDGSVVTINDDNEITVVEAENGQKGVVELGLCTGVTEDDGKVPVLNGNGKVPYAALPIQTTTVTIGSATNVPALLIYNDSNTVIGTAPLIDSVTDSIHYQLLPYANTTTPGILKTDEHSTQLVNGREIRIGNGVVVTHLSSATTSTGTTIISETNIKNGFVAIVCSSAVTTRTLKLPLLTKNIANTQIQTCELMVRALKDTANTSNTTFTLAFQYVDDNSVTQTLYLMSGESQVVLERGYSYFFVFRNFPSCLDTNTLTTVGNSALNKRQWTGNLQGRVPLRTS